MIGLLLQRSGQSLLTLFLTSLLIFIGTEVLPGDVATALLGQSASAETLEAIRQSLGLHDPAPLRYWAWLKAFLQGDLGRSMTNERPIAPELWSRLGATFFLAAVAAAIAIPLAVTLGILTAVHRNGWFDRLTNLSGLIAISLPEFFIAYLLIAIVSVELDLAPSLASLSPDDGLWRRLHAIALPAATLVLAVLAYVMRMTRTALLSVMAQPYVEMATLKGLTRTRIILRHALPNATSPIIQVVGFNLAYMVVGVVLVEVVFVYPGVGQYLVDAVAKRDVPVVQACGLIFAATYIFLNFVADAATILLNPRLRYPR